MNQAQLARFNATWRAFEAVSPWLAMMLFWILVNGPSLLNNIESAPDPAVMIDDVRIVRYHSFRFTDPELFVDLGRLT
jgi:hypothetical protein